MPVLVGRHDSPPEAIEVASRLDRQRFARVKLDDLQHEVQLIGQETARPRLDLGADGRLVDRRDLDDFLVDVTPPERQQLGIGEHIPDLLRRCIRQVPDFVETE